MADKQRSTRLKQPEQTKSVTLSSPYEPIAVHDQFGNPYVCLNYYEAIRVRDMLISLQARGITDYDTGDWWLDLPPKLTKWLSQQDTRSTQESSKGQQKNAKK